jgi:hypothetical protein
MTSRKEKDMSQGTEDNFFTALGPNDLYKYGFATSGAQLDFGGLLEGLTLGAFGASTEASPVFNQALPIFRVGVWGQGDKVGVYGMTSAAGPNSGFNGEPRLAGVIGTSDTRPGVVGTSFESPGVLGQAGEAFGLAPAGVCGTSQQQIGVYASSSGNRGVFGESERSIGVHGASNQSIGVQGWSAGPGPNFGGERIAPAGVVGTSQNNPGVIGTSTQSFGVAGQSGAPGPSSSSAGVFGTSAASFGVAGTSQTFPGVIGISTNSFGMIAISGSAGPLFGLPFPLPAAVLATSSKNPGVIGTSNASHGVAGLSSALPTPGTTPAQVPAGVHGESTNGAFGVLGATRSTPTSPGAGVTGICTGNGFGVFGYNVNPAGYAGYFTGNLHAEGQITAPVKNAVVSFPDGSKRVLHCMESPEHWFEDFGSARLKRGRATVKLDADFAKVVRLDGYRVFLTPEGDCKGLYVRGKRGISFEVRELQGGTSGIAFSYRIVAKRKDIKRHTRFARIEIPAVPPPRGRKPPRLPSSMRTLFTTLEK